MMDDLDIDTLRQISQIMYYHKNYDACERVLNRIIESDSGCLDAKYNLSILMILIKNKDYHKSRKMLTECINNNFKKINCMVLIIKTFLLSNDFLSALKFYEDFIDKNEEKNNALLFYKAYVLFELRNLNESENILRNLIYHRSYLGECYYLLSYISELQGNKTSAIENIKFALLTKKEKKYIKRLAMLS